MTPRGLRVVLTVFCFLALIGWLGFSVTRALTPPMITLREPSEGAVVRQAAITVAGIAPDAYAVTINGTPILIHGTNGAFEEAVPLQPGANVLHIRARKRHSGNRVIDRRIFYRVDNSPENGL